jgi:hypothetical protein
MALLMRRTHAKGAVFHGSLPSFVARGRGEVHSALAGPAAFVIKSAMALRFTGFERRRQPVASRHTFAWRMLIAIALWFVIAVVGMAIGMAGYAYYEGMSLADAYVNAAMILSGMGPVGDLKTTAGKIFAGTYAIFSGLVIIIATGFVLAPIFHRVLHRFHVESGKDSE